MDKIHIMKNLLPGDAANEHKQHPHDNKQIINNNTIKKKRYII